MIFALIFGIVLNELEILPENALQKANGYTFILAGALCNIFVSLNQVSVSQFVDMITPIIVVFASGLFGSTVTAIIVASLIKIPYDLSIALSSAAYFGFPGTYMIPTEVAKAITKDINEQKKILDYILPKMVLSGIISMSVVSVIIASVFVRYL